MALCRIYTFCPVVHHVDYKPRNQPSFIISPDCMPRKIYGWLHNDACYFKQTILSETSVMTTWPMQTCFLLHLEVTRCITQTGGSFSQILIQNKIYNIVFKNYADSTRCRNQSQGKHFAESWLSSFICDPAKRCQMGQYVCVRQAIFYYEAVRRQYYDGDNNDR